MMRRTFTIDLLEDCVFSARSATEGGHESLDRIPGAALLGATAARLYAQLSPRDAYAVFHSGRLRFHDGLPLACDAVGYPVPQAWHHRKTEKAHADYAVRASAERIFNAIPERIFNLLHGQIPPGSDGFPAQPKQLRKGYIHANGVYSQPAHELRLKTAIDAKTGRAADAQLFGYDALLRGQRFAAAVEADGDFDPELFARVVKALTGTALLGRSRSAEYGAVRIEPTELPWPEPGPATDRLTLWLLSDLAPCDELGQPTLELSATHLGFVEGSANIIWDKTFLRTRRYSPWNAARQGYDRERMVFTAGGVITLELAASLDPRTLATLQAGISQHREAGLGRLWVNPPLLATPNPVFSASASAQDVRPQPTRPDHPLIVWLEAQNSAWKTAAEERAREIATKFHDALDNARRAAGVPEHATDFGPSKSQWGKVLEAARQCGGHALYDKLFEGDGAVIKKDMPGWKVETPLRPGEWKTLAAWLREQLAPDNQSDAQYAHLVRSLAHHVRGDTRAKKQRSA